MSSLVRAAGGVIVRSAAESGPELLVVHRPRYDDWTLPKGKAEPGESDEECALREVEEETGLLCELGPEVAVSEYEDAAGRPKRVRYFEMTPPEGAEAAPQNEIDDVRWLTRQRALDTLSYARDRAIVESLAALAAP
jgi:8-oxo-dGTP pyrophosphatase MutT (NUDIX family)